jgi:uncharacterized protein (DUF433 family)
MRKRLSKHIVADTSICHGKPTFVGTRIMVWQVLEQLAEGMTWKEIETEWNGKVTAKSIQEAVTLASEQMMNRWGARSEAKGLTASA